MLQWRPRLVALALVVALVRDRSGSASVERTSEPVLVAGSGQERPPAAAAARVSSFPSAWPVSASRCAAAVSFAVTPHRGEHAARGRRTAGPPRPSPTASRCRSRAWTRGGVSLSFVFGVASIVLFGWAAGLLVVFLAPAVDPAHGAPAPDADRLQRLGAGAGRDRGRSALGAAPRCDRAERRAGPRRSRCLGAVLRQPRPDHRRRRGQLAALPVGARPLQRPLDDRAVLADGLGCADAGRPLAALALPVGRARRAAARDPALPARDRPRPARDAAGADRPADRARQPPPFPRAARARARAGTGAPAAAFAVPRRRRRLQADQRPLRTSGRRPRALASSRRGCARPARRSGSAATSSRCCFPATTSRRAGRSVVDRRADRRAGPRPDRAGDRQRRRRDLAAARGRARRADPARRQRALLGQGVRQEPRPRLPAGRDRARRAEAPGERPRPGGALPGRREPRARGRRPQRLHAAATRSASRTSPPARRAGSVSPTRRSS